MTVLLYYKSRDRIDDNHADGVVYCDRLFKTLSDVQK